MDLFDLSKNYICARDCGSCIELFREHQGKIKILEAKILSEKSKTSNTKVAKMLFDETITKLSNELAEMVLNENNVQCSNLCRLQHLIMTNESAREELRDELLSFPQCSEVLIDRLERNKHDKSRFHQMNNITLILKQMRACGIRDKWETRVQPVTEKKEELTTVESVSENNIAMNESKVEQPVVESKVEQPVVESKVEQPVVESKVEQPVVESKVEQNIVVNDDEEEDKKPTVLKTANVKAAGKKARGGKR